MPRELGAGCAEMELVALLVLGLMFVLRAQLDGRDILARGFMVQHLWIIIVLRIKNYSL